MWQRKLYFDSRYLDKPALFGSHQSQLSDDQHVIDKTMILSPGTTDTSLNTVKTGQHGALIVIGDMGHIIIQNSLDNKLLSNVLDTIYCNNHVWADHLQFRWSI